MIDSRQFIGNHIVRFFYRNGLVIAHHTELNAIFVDIKASHSSLSVHRNEIFKFTAINLRKNVSTTRYLKTD